VNALPETLQTAMTELVSLTPSHFAAAVEKNFRARVATLSPSDREAFKNWWSGLSEDELLAVEAAIYGNSR
jgi:hypothetical protein